MPAPIKRFSKLRFFTECALLAVTIVGSGAIMSGLERPSELAESELYVKHTLQVGVFLDSLKAELAADNQTELLSGLSGLTDYLVTYSSGPNAPDNLNWDFESSVFFCVTIMTTIGYGSFPH